MKRKILSVALAALPCITFAAGEANTLDSVVVIGQRSTARFDGEDVGSKLLSAQRAATSDTASLLKDVPGVSLYGAGGVSSLPAIHGLADDRLRIKVDGMDLIASCPNHMNPALSYIDPTNIGALKVYAGITPVSVGGDSIGGSIVAETAPPVFAAPGQDSLFKGEVGTFYRNNGNAVGGNVAATYATESFNVSYTGATAKSDNYKASGDFKDSIYGTSSASPTVTGRIGHTLPLDEVGSTAYETRNHTLGLAFRGGNHLVEAKFGYQDMPYQLYPNQRMDMLDNEQKRLNLGYLGSFDWGTLDARAYYERVNHYMDFGADKRWWYGNGAPPVGSGGSAAANGSPCSPLSTTCATGMPMYTEGKTTGASVKASIDLSERDILRIGGEYQSYHLDDWWPPSGAGMWPNTFLNINDGQRNRTALFGEWEKRFNPQWMSQLGVRYERVHTEAGAVHGYGGAGGMDMSQTADAAAFNNSDRSKTDNNWDLTALAKYTRDAGMDIDFGFARKVRSPNLYERYTWSTAAMMMGMNNTVGDGNGYVGDVNLKPERAHILSATFDWHAVNRDWEFKATPYYTHVSDYIDAVLLGTTTSGFNRLRYANQNARLYGIDLSGKMPLGKTGIGEFSLKGLLNYTNGKNTDTNNGLYNIMPLNAKLSLTQMFGGWDNAVELVMVKGKNDGSDVRNEITTPGYNLVNLRGSYSWKQVRVDFGIENLFDKLYYLPNGGAYIGQGTTMTMTTAPTGSVPAWGTAVPGMGRSLYAGINVKF